MLIGHVALGLAANTVEPRVSLTTVSAATIAGITPFPLRVGSVDGYRDAVGVAA